MMMLLFVLAALICFMIWPWIYLLHFRSAHTPVLKQYIALFSPSAVLLAVYLYYSEQQSVIRSQACGIVMGYQSYMSSGNKNKRKPFERVEIVFNDTKYTRHLRIDEKIQKLPTGTKACFEYYDRKLNPHMQDSVLIQWQH